MQLLLVALLLLNFAALAQDRPRRPREREALVAKPPPASTADPKDKLIAAQFAPIFYQGLGEQPRADYITSFDFDGDWKGDNNWQNLNNRAYPLRAYIYYSVAETPTHYFVHYAAFHPRDYKGDAITSTLLDEAIRQALPQLGKTKDPAIEKVNEVALSHENDLEGCLVVALKHGDDPAQAQVQYVETMAHNSYLKYRTPAVSTSIGEPIEMNGSHPLLFIEPKGHGITRYTADAVQPNKRVSSVLIYRYTGQAGDPESVAGKELGYDLQPIYHTLWQHAQQGENETYGETVEYPKNAILKFQSNQQPVSTEQQFSALGSAFRGSVGFKNKARPPWAWFDGTERDRPRGEWFFNPAAVVARHFSLEQSFATAYLRNLYFGIGKD